MTGHYNMTERNILVEERTSREILLGNVSSRKGKLVLADGTVFEGVSFGYDGPVAGEVVFGTGMVGYPESLTDASFSRQILVMTYPIIGNYGVPEQSAWEDERIHVAGLIVSNYIDIPSHAQSRMNLGTWLQREKVPALEIADTRQLTQHIREHGVMPGKIIFDADIPFYDPDAENLVARVSTKQVTIQETGEYGRGDPRGRPDPIEYGRGDPRGRPGSNEYGRGDPRGRPGPVTIALIDCGAKRNIERSLLARNVRVVTVPWDYDLFAPTVDFSFDGIMISNGPGNPKTPQQTIATIREAMGRRIPVFGICLGHQLLALAAGGDTYKLKFGHRSQNQPCVLYDTKRCYITTQNHGFAVGTLPPHFVPWFVNANDGSNEGIHHIEYPFFSVQFHPEAAPGPLDTEWLFDYFLEKVRG